MLEASGTLRSWKLTRNVAAKRPQSFATAAGETSAPAIMNYYTGTITLSPDKTTAKV
jgi:hypothetical protein